MAIAPIADSQRFGMSESAKQLQALLARREFLMSVPTEHQSLLVRRRYGLLSADTILFYLEIAIAQQVCYLMCGEQLPGPYSRNRGAA